MIMADASSTISDSSDHDMITSTGINLGTPVFNLLPAIWHSSLDFVYSNRILSHMYTHLGLKGNRTKRLVTSAPGSWKCG